VLPCHTRNITDLLTSATYADKTIPRLIILIERLEAQAGSNYEKDYVKDLRGSLFSLQGKEKEYYLQSKGAKVKEFLSDHLRRCKEHVREIYAAILSALTSLIKVKNSFSMQINSSSAIAANVKQ
jgi:hypothetical protein